MPACSVTSIDTQLEYQTMIRGGMKVNMLPTTANATLNVRCDPGTAVKLRLYLLSRFHATLSRYRIAPGETTEAVLAHFRRVIDDDRIQVR
jgi:acetylornithine deacetylase/succinyl-diaminopimelate desuccinylase-like protein